MATTAKKSNNPDQSRPTPGAYLYPANSNVRPKKTAANVTSLNEQSRQHAGSPYAGVDQSQTVPVDNVDFLHARYGIDYRPGHQQAANNNAAPKSAAATASGRVTAAATSTQPAAPYTATHPTPPTTRPVPPKKPIKIKVTPQDHKKSSYKKIKHATTVIMAFSFVGLLATLQIMSSAFATVALGFAGVVASIGPLNTAMAIMQNFTGFDMMALVFMFWILSMAVGLTMIFGLLFLFTFRGLKPASGNMVGVKLLLVLATFITASFPILNLFTILMVATWILVVWWYA